MVLQISLFLMSLFSLNSDVSKHFVFGDEKAILVNFKNLLVSIREQKISPNEARKEFSVLMRELREIYPNQLEEESVTKMVFPLVGSNLAAVGGNGTGYYITKFDLFDQNVSGSHPAHDIFIYDPDHDCIDNRKNKFIDIVSVSNGVVLASETNWSDKSDYRGGNYVWVYDFERGALWYYAHLRKVVVEAGQIVKAGGKLGEVGRTGARAKEARSDTHLHLMHLRLNDDLLPEPVNYYKMLKNSKFVNVSTEAVSNKIIRTIYNATLLVPIKAKPTKNKNVSIKNKKATLASN
jgi:peptidoglycan LD-endopeptidase LytH